MAIANLVGICEYPGIPDQCRLGMIEEQISWLLILKELLQIMNKE